MSSDGTGPSRRGPAPRPVGGFVGRAAEVALFRRALGGDDRAFAVLFLHGPGGIGKSELLRRFAAEARAAGRPVVELDGRTVDPTPAGFEKEAGAALADERVVLLVDTFEHCRRLEGWLRDHFLPRLPTGVVTVVAGRRGPEPDWVSDPGWAELLRVTALRNLAPDEAVPLLDAHGVPRAAQGALLAFTGGHPLALALAASVAAEDGTAAERWQPSGDVIETLLPQLVGEMPSPAHRRALGVCAHLHVTTEAALRTVLGEEAAALFAWLRELPFVEAAAGGLCPHDVVREALEADLRRRDPAGYADMHLRLHQHLFERVRTAPETERPVAVGALLHLYRSDRHLPDFFTWGSDGEVQEEPYAPADRGTVLALAAEAEGPESAALARHWLDRQPGAFRVHRSTRSGAVVAFAAWLRLTGPEGTEADPVAAAAWAHTRAAAPLRGDEYLALARFAVHPAAYQRRSAVMDLMQWRALGAVFHDRGPAWSCVVLQRDAFWAPHMRHFEMDPLPTRPVVDGREHALFVHDWRARTAARWLEARSRLLLAGAAGEPAGPTDLVVLSRPEFDAAVRAGLRALRRPAGLERNPLARSRVVAESGGTLHEVLVRAVEELRTGRGGEKQHRAVAAAYLRGPLPQRAVAERLGLPFSTYRRHLASGTERLCTSLWRRELSGS